MFKKLALALTFSPTGKVLVSETKRLADLFNAEVVFIHNGEKTPETESRLNELIVSAGFDLSSISIDWVTGDVADSIIASTKKNEVELLISGALEKENLIKHLFGSVARKIMTEASCSVLILTSPNSQRESFKKFYVSVDYSPENEKAIRTAFDFALKENAEEFTLIKDFHIPGLTLTIQDGATVDEVNELKNQWQQDEETKLQLFAHEMNLKGLEIKTKCVYGKEGWRAGNFARANEADIFTVSAPKKKIRFIDKLFPHEFIHTFEKLPTNLLIVR